MARHDFDIKPTTQKRNLETLRNRSRSRPAETFQNLETNGQPVLTEMQTKHNIQRKTLGKTTAQNNKRDSTHKTGTQASNLKTSSMGQIGRILQACGLLVSGFM
jgi:hypothetical protein